MMRSRVQSSRGGAFTLIELILVLVVIAVALGAVVPSLRGSSRTARLRDSAEQFVTLTRVARLRAVSGSTPHRVVIDAGKRRCVLAAQVGLQFSEAAGGGDTDVEFEWPENVIVQVVQAAGVGGAGRGFIDFLPTGRTTPAVVRFTAVDDGEYVEAACVTPTESFKVVKPGEAP